jgi:predicted alpha/beta superfamily hydrolase
MAQYSKVTIPNSEVRSIISSIVPGQEYQLQVMLPAGYNNSNEIKYPVVYLMDAQWDFPLVASLYGQQYYDGFIPSMIIVGVTWGGANPNPDSLRARDYTPTNEKRLPQSGGASRFLAVLKNEVIPFIEKNYRVENNDRTLMGCSLGGLFTVYTLFTEPDLFQRYVAASPAYGWGNQVIYQYEKKYFENKSNPPARLFMCVGGVERGVPGFNKLTDLLNSRHYSNLKIESRVLENTGHSGTKGEGFARGLQFVFAKPKLDFPVSVLDKYAGSYQSENGSTIEIKTEDNKLAIYFGANNKYVLYAADETDFYAMSEFLKIHFHVNDSGVDGFQMDQYSGSQHVKRIQ